MSVNKYSELDPKGKLIVKIALVWYVIGIALMAQDPGQFCLPVHVVEAFLLGMIAYHVWWK